MGTRNARSSGTTFSGRSRGRSSSSRTAGITFVARHGRCVFSSVRHSASCRSRSSSSTKRRCLNPVTVALRDKIISSRILQSAGVPTPTTYVVSRLNRLEPLLGAGPLVVKPCQDTCGVDVRVVRSVAELATVPAGKAPVIAQRYHAPEGRDRKIYSIGGRLFGVKKPFPARTEEEKHGEPFTPAPELCEIALRCGRAFGIDLYGVDIIESAGQPYVVDMSSIPGFKGVPDAPLHLAEYFYNAAERAVHHRELQEPAARIEPTSPTEFS